VKKKRVPRTDNFNLDQPINQEDFASMIGLSQQNVSKLIRFGVLSPEGTFGNWVREYDRFVKGQCFARRGWQGLADFY
jgi:hypothetical protein